MSAQIVVDALYVVAAVLTLLAFAVVLTIWRGLYIEQEKRSQVKLVLTMMGVSITSVLVAAVAGVVVPDIQVSGWAQYSWLGSLAVLGCFVLFKRLRNITHERQQWLDEQADSSATSSAPQEERPEGQD